MTDEWSLKDELCSISEEGNISLALSNLDILESPEEEFVINKGEGWSRGGAETYIYKFSVEKKRSGKSEEFIIKACAPFSPAIDIDKTLKSWIKRRKILSDYGICTPRLVAVSDGLILEEYIPYLLRSKISKDGHNQDKLLPELAHYAGILSKLGFSPISPFKDLRSRSNDVVVVDFGEDIGGLNVSQKVDNKIFDDLLLTIRKWGISPGKSMIGKMYSIYSEASTRKQ